MGKQFSHSKTVNILSKKRIVNRIEEFERELYDLYLKGVIEYDEYDRLVEQILDYCENLVCDARNNVPELRETVKLQ